MSRYIRVPPRRSFPPRFAVGAGLLAPLVTLLLVFDPGGSAALLRSVVSQPVMLAVFLLAPAFAAMQAVVTMPPREQARPVPVRVRTGNRHLLH